MWRDLPGTISVLMLFNSLEFLIFLPIVFLIYWYAFPGNYKGQNIFIVFISYVFYGWWDWTFLFLILFTSLCSYISGLLIGHSRIRNKIITAANIIINLFILGVYKYYDFFIESFVNGFSQIGIPMSLTTLNLILPVGISFYTFQALSYTIDVYRNQIKPERNIFTFFAFISFFPQLVAGPIERATHLLPQFAVPRVFNYHVAVDGVRQILWGAFKKVVIADNCATIVNSIFDNYELYNGSTLFLGAIFFTFQIYGDFSGYSDIAVGTAKLFGIQLMRNFNFPYFSRDFAEFWRRWHISLTTWFRDYIYIPLGGSKKGKWVSIRNTFIIFLVSGLWHGANWTFVVWGIYHATLFLPLLLLAKNRRNLNTVAEGKMWPAFRELTGMFVTFIFVVFGWIIFRAKDIDSAYKYIGNIFSRSFFSQPELFSKKTFLFILVLLLVEWCQRTRQHGLDFSYSTHKYIRYSMYFFIVFIILVYAGNQSNFIYFQF